MGLRRALVITSISRPNDVLRHCASACKRHGIDFVLIGDLASPPDFQLDGCDFWSIERQRTLPLALARYAPERHYARKNLGYLIAMQRGAKIIVETDDDNMPDDAFWTVRSRDVAAHVVAGAGWINAYRYFTDALIWPRGFPLELVHAPVPPLAAAPEPLVCCPIQQGLADANPDVDAVYRLLFPLPQSFPGKVRVALGSNACCPFNSQNTTWFADAFCLLYLPSTCSFRMTDIWRSLVAQRIARENGWHVLFHEATVVQERNAHNLLRDFEDEVPGYLGNTRIWQLLESLQLRGGTASLTDDMRAAYTCLVEHGYCAPAELSVLDAWLTDIGSLSPRA